MARLFDSVPGCARKIVPGSPLLRNTILGNRAMPACPRARRARPGTIPLIPVVYRARRKKPCPAGKPVIARDARARRPPYYIGVCIQTYPM